MKTLFENVRSEHNLFSAWRHVRKSAHSSLNSEIRGFAAEFEHHHQRHLKRIYRQLHEERFEFDEVNGVLKDKRKRIAAGKDPRPIAIATLKNRVVQRAILQTLQPRKARDERELTTKYSPIDDPRLGKLNLVNRSPYGVGGLMHPFGGVRPAIQLIMGAMARGSLFYYQSDIKSFFTKIPTSVVVDVIRRETKDEKLSQLFARGLEINLKNKDELLSYAKLFPANGVGVAQGSSLSTFAGNVLLYDFDHELNRMGVTAVRYIDDLLIVSKSVTLLEKAILYSEDHLASFGFSLYSPVAGSDKASQGECKDSLKFLGCTLQPNRCVPSKQSIDRIVLELGETISASKKSINALLSEGKPLNPKLSSSAALQFIGHKLYGWQKSYGFCTDADTFRKLDEQVAAKISDYEHWVRRKLNSASSKYSMQILGIPSTEHQFRTDSIAAHRKK